MPAMTPYVSALLDSVFCVLGVLLGMPLPCHLVCRPSILLWELLYISYCLPLAIDSAYGMHSNPTSPHSFIGVSIK